MEFNFEKLIAYQKSLSYIDFVYDVTNEFSKNEQFSLTDQYRRAAISISLNIGEGSSGTKKEFINFLRISNRSLRECVVCTTIAQRRNYISKEVSEKSRSLLIEIAKLNSGLINSLKNLVDLRKPSTNYKLPTPN
jgi:four helix bundle protein